MPFRIEFHSKDPVAEKICAHTNTYTHTSNLPDFWCFTFSERAMQWASTFDVSIMFNVDEGIDKLSVMCKNITDAL